MNELIAIPAITVICYLIAEGVKAAGLEWLPVISGLCGAVLGGVAMAVMPGYPAQDILSAVAIGIVSGLAATGANQAVKQLSKKK